MVIALLLRARRVWTAKNKYQHHNGVAKIITGNIKTKKERARQKAIDNNVAVGDIDMGSSIRRGAVANAIVLASSGEHERHRDISKKQAWRAGGRRDVKRASRCVVQT